MQSFEQGLIFLNERIFFTRKKILEIICFVSWYTIIVKYLNVVDLVIFDKVIFKYSGSYNI